MNKAVLSWQRVQDGPSKKGQKRGRISIGRRL